MKCFVLSLLFVPVFSFAADVNFRQAVESKPSVGSSPSSSLIAQVSSTTVCCLSREKVDSGPRIGPVYRYRTD